MIIFKNVSKVLLYPFKKDLSKVLGVKLTNPTNKNGISIKDISRNELFIATKIGRYTDNNSNSGAGGYFDFSPSKIEQSIKKSMNNMNIKYIHGFFHRFINNIK